MKLREFLANLNNLVKESPDILDLDVVTAIDDESNGFKPVVYKPSIGRFDGHDGFANDKEAAKEPNAICLN